MKIGLIAGSFDVLHPGYIEMFEQMKDECDQIWVLLQTDPTIERPEKMKPVLSVKDRASMLIALRHVNHVITYTLESELHYKLKQFAENKSAEYVRYLGDDYIGKKFTGDDLDLPIQYLSRDHGWSTTKYKKLIADEVQRSSNI